MFTKFYFKPSQTHALLIENNMHFSLQVHALLHAHIWYTPTWTMKRYQSRMELHFYIVKTQLPSVSNHATKS